MKNHTLKKRIPRLAFCIGMGISTVNAATAAPFDPFTDPLLDSLVFKSVVVTNQPFVFIDQLSKNERLSSQNGLTNVSVHLDPLTELLLEFFSPPPKSKL